MTNKYMDLHHEALARYLDRIDEGFTGIQRIMYIFIRLKNEIMYDCIKKSEQLASETLVMGRGDNFSKNNLLCALLILAGYDCELKYKNVRDNTKWLFSRNGKVIPWYYVSVNYFGKILNFDCSFDRGFMGMAMISYEGDKSDYGLDNYCFAEGRVFEIVNDPFKSETKASKLEINKTGSGELCI